MTISYRMYCGGQLAENPCKFDGETNYYVLPENGSYLVLLFLIPFFLPLNILNFLVRQDPATARPPRQ